METIKVKMQEIKRMERSGEKKNMENRAEKIVKRIKKPVSRLSELSLKIWIRWIA